MLLFHHGKELVVTQLHIAEADENAVGHGTAPHLRVCQGTEAQLIQIRLHIQEQPAAGYKIHLQNVIPQGKHGRNVFPLQGLTSFPGMIKRPTVLDIVQ